MFLILRTMLGMCVVSCNNDTSILITMVHDIDSHSCIWVGLLLQEKDGGEREGEGGREKERERERER